MSFAVVEFQGFCFADQLFIPKEICVIFNDFKCHFIIKSPMKYLELNNKERCIVNWNEKNYHGLLWECGDLEWSECVEIISKMTKDVETFYVKGLEKGKFLSRVFQKHCVDLSKFGCPNIRNLRENCEHHTINSARCALKTAEFLFDWHNGYTNAPKTSQQTQQAKK